MQVAPVRERGLKYHQTHQRKLIHNRRSRKGAWIEIPDARLQRPEYLGRSRKGAWIEIAKKQAALQRANVAPVRERGLKYKLQLLQLSLCAVAPVRERGLKCHRRSI